MTQKDADPPPPYDAVTTAAPRQPTPEPAPRAVSVHSTLDSRGYVAPKGMKAWQDESRWRELEQREGTCCSESGGAVCSTRGGLCFSDRGGVMCSDRDGVLCSDRGGVVCSDYGGVVCSDTGGVCCSVEGKVCFGAGK